MFLPSEWHRQCAVQLTWPDETTDWEPYIDEARVCFYNMAREISVREPLIIVAQQPDDVKHQLVTGLDGRIDESQRLSDCAMQNITFFQCPINDTWARDHAFITCFDEGRRKFLDFQFNGWGMKFAANNDNQINQRLYPMLLSADANPVVANDMDETNYCPHLDFVLEGGSIESDGKGTLLTTASCLLAPNRNEPMDREAIDSVLREIFSCSQVLWLDHGYLAGDDTDGHIDTLARLCPDDTITYVACDDESDEHYEELQLMQQQLQSFHTLDGRPYRLIPLPMPDAMYDDEGNRLPAAYANFLIMNGAVLCPTYSQPEKDAEALAKLKTAFPDREIVGIDCRVLVLQHGSLHCCTMQYPAAD